MEMTLMLPAARLEQLEQYLCEDPANACLLAEACEAAITTGEHERAAAHLRVAEELHLDALEWRLLRARLALARHDWPEALKELAAVQQAVGAHPAVEHDVAFVRFRMEDYAGCRSAIAPWLRMIEEADLEPDLQDALQTLWLRACHQLGSLDEARDWVHKQQQSDTLRPAAAGVASLIAIDRGDFGAARMLADMAIDAGIRQCEALVARASVALAEQDAARAEQLLREALAMNEAEGRAWSALGLAKLQARDPEQARQHLDRATRLMPGHIGTWHALGWACVLLQDLDAAERAFESALRIDRNFAESHAAIGLVRVLSGRPGEADHHLAMADGLDRKNLTGRYARALQSGELRDAKAVHELAVRLLDRPGFFGGALSDSLGTVKK